MERTFSILQGQDQGPARERRPFLFTTQSERAGPAHERPHAVLACGLRAARGAPFVVTRTGATGLPRSRARAKQP